MTKKPTVKGGPRVQVNVRMAPTEYKLLQGTAESIGLNLSSWMRMVAIQAAKERVRETKESSQ